MTYLMNELTVGLGDQHLDGGCFGLKMPVISRSDREVRSLENYQSAIGKEQVCEGLDKRNPKLDKHQR